MASFKAGTVSLTTSDSGTKAVTGVGFTPKCVIFWTAGDTRSGNVSGIPGTMFGVSTGASENFAVLATARDNRTDALGYSTVSNTLCILLRHTSSLSGGRYVMSSLDSDGFTLTVTEKVQGNITVNYLAIGGSDVSAKAGTVAFPATNTTFGLTGLAFQPNALIVAGARASNVTTDAHQGYGNGFCVGFTDGTTTGHALWSRAQAATTNVKSLVGTSSIVQLASADATFTRSATFTSFNADGFTLTAAGSATNASLLGYLALNVPAVKAFNDAMETSVTTFAQSGWAFQPAALLVASACEATVAGTAADVVDYSLGLTDGTTSLWGNLYDHDNLATSDSTATVGSGALLKGYERTAADTFGVDASVQLSSFDGDGVTFSQDDAAPAAGLIVGLAFGLGLSGWLSTSRLHGISRGVVGEMASRLGGALEY